MKTYHQPSGLTQGLDLLISADWTPDQALAVIELLDDLRDRIWVRYELALFELIREDRGGDRLADASDDWSDDPPF